MSEFVNNPRRAPRAAIGCDARVALKDGSYFTGATVDYGPQGCQLVSPHALSPDERIFVELKSASVPEPCWFSGRIAWAHDAAPFRAGVHFDAGSCGDARGFFFKLADTHPDAIDTSRAPSQLPLDARVVPAHDRSDEPRALSPGEAEVMRAVGDGARIRELREELGGRWEPRLNALFSLLARGALEVEQADRADPAP